MIGQEGLPVELACEEVGELTQTGGVKLPGGRHRALLQFTGRLGVNALRCPGDHRCLAKAELTVGKRLRHHGQLAQLGRDLDTLRRVSRLLKFLSDHNRHVLPRVMNPVVFEHDSSFAGFAHFHTGLDLAVPLGTPVFAAADGAVVFARGMADSTGNLIGYGNYILIQHDANLRTLYGHLMTIGVKEGDIVKRGQLIGLVGSTGNSTGPHTHFEVRLEESPIDPMNLLSMTDPSAPALDPMLIATH